MGLPYLHKLAVATVHMVLVDPTEALAICRIAKKRVFIVMLFGAPLRN